MDVSLMLGRKKEIEEFNFDLGGIVEMYKEVAEAQKEVGGEFCFRAKVPTGGGKSFDIITGDEDSDTSVPAISGVIIHNHACNAYFAEDSEGNAPPVCSSLDGVTGVDTESGEFCSCADCPRNEFGSAAKGSGKACKNMHRLYMLTEGSPVPLLVTLPPTSVKNFKTYRLATLAANRLKPHEAVTELTLTPMVSKSNQKYSTVKFKMLGKLNSEARNIAASMSIALKPTNEVNGEDYNRANTEVLSDGSTENTEKAE